MKFEVLSLNFDQLQDYWRLSSGLHFQYLLVLFVPIWESHKKHEIRLSKCILDSSLKFNTPFPDQIHRIQESVCICKVLVAGQDAVENYVVENLRVHDLPCVVMYSGDGVPLFFEDKRNMFQLNPFYSQMINMVSSSATIITRLKNSLRSADIIPALFCTKESEEASSYESSLRVFVAGSRSTAGKTSLCLAILKALTSRYGVSASILSYIKPVTQCEAEQPLTRFCKKSGIACAPIGPVVFYKGFTRAFLSEETGSSADLLQSVTAAVHENSSLGRRLQLVDGVGYPAVGSICGISNADVAKILDVPVLMLGKAGVGDAVDSYNLDTNFFRSYGVSILGGIFNKLPTSGFYNIDSCKEAVTSYFLRFRPDEMPYGFIPEVVLPPPFIGATEEEREEQFQEALVDALLQNVQLERLILDIWCYQFLRRSAVYHSTEDGSIIPSSSTTKTTSTSSSSSSINLKSVPMSGTDSVVFPNMARETLQASVSFPDFHSSRKRPRDRFEIEAEARSSGAPTGA